MSRRKPPPTKWHVGDKCQYPVYLQLQGNKKPIIRWHDAEIVAIRNENDVVIRVYKWEHDWPAHTLRTPPQRGNALTRILNKLGHDRHQRTTP